jgi:hypothetical protein
LLLLLDGFELSHVDFRTPPKYRSKCCNCSGGVS